MVTYITLGGIALVVAVMTGIVLYIDDRDRHLVSLAALTLCVTKKGQLV